MGDLNLTSLLLHRLATQSHQRLCVASAGFLFLEATRTQVESDRPVSSFPGRWACAPMQYENAADDIDDDEILG